MTRTHLIEFYDSDGEVMSRAVYVCDYLRALSAAAERAEAIGAEDYDVVRPERGDEDEEREAA